MHKLTIETAAHWRLLTLGPQRARYVQEMWVGITLATECSGSQSMLKYKAEDKRSVRPDCRFHTI